jgi:hypothetical protein
LYNLPTYLPIYVRYDLEQRADTDTGKEGPSPSSRFLAGRNNKKKKKVRRIMEDGHLVFEDDEDAEDMEPKHVLLQRYEQSLAIVDTLLNENAVVAQQVVVRVLFYYVLPFFSCL